MIEPARHYERESEVRASLRALSGLTPEILANALIFGEAERRGCTENDPGILRGMIGWGRPIRSLREQLRPSGWKRVENGSLPLVVSPDGKVALTVETGDDQTGNPKSRYARTEYPKGPMLREWANGHQQLSLEEDGEETPVPDLWILLVRRTSTEIIAELSRPTSAGKDKRLHFAGERIFLPPIPVDRTMPYAEEEDEEPSANVSVERI